LCVRALRPPPQHADREHADRRQADARRLRDFARERRVVESHPGGERQTIDQIAVRVSDRSQAQGMKRVCCRGTRNAIRVCNKGHVPEVSANPFVVERSHVKVTGKVVSVDDECIPSPEITWDDSSRCRYEKCASSKGVFLAIKSSWRGRITDQS